MKALANLYPDSIHARDVGLASAADGEVWAYAEAHRLTIVSKDADFHQRSFLHGPPPKVIWIRLGNCTTDEILALLRDRQRELLDFEADAGGAFLALG